MSREDSATAKRDRGLRVAAAAKAKENRDGTTHVPIPHVVLDSPGYLQASPLARALLLDFSEPLFRSGGGAWPGRPNGGLMVENERLRRRGWNSNDVISRKLKELLKCGLLVCTRQGGKGTKGLYAVTWLGLGTSPSAYRLDIAHERWAAFRGSYMRPECESAAAPTGERTKRAREARQRNAEARRIAKSAPSDSRSGSACAPSDGADAMRIAPSHGAKTCDSAASSAPSDGASIEYRHLPAISAACPPGAHAGANAHRDHVASQAGARGSQ